MKNFFSGGVNAALTIVLVIFYVALAAADGIRELAVDITGRWGAMLLPITSVIALKIGFNFAHRVAIPIIVACGLVTQAAFAGIMSLWQVRWILSFNPPVGNVPLDYYLNLDDVRLAGGYWGRLMADLTVDILMGFPRVMAMESSEALSWGMSGLFIVVMVMVCVAFWFFPDGRIGKGDGVHKGHGHGKGRKKVVIINK